MEGTQSYSEAYAQRVRMRRFALSTAVYAIWTLVFCIAWLLGLTDVTGTQLGLLAAGVTVTVFAWHQVFATGLNLRFTDPALTEAQTLTGLAWVLVLMYLAGPLRDLVIPAVLITLLFGVFALDRLGFLRLGAFTLTGYVAVSAALWWRAPEAVIPAAEVLRLVVMLAVLTWGVLFGSYVGRLRATLKTRNAELVDAMHSASRLARRDELTESLNRRSLMERLAEESVRAAGEARPLAVVLLDLDHFKLVNDEHGHLVGDEVLRSFSRLARHTLREVDSVGRPRAFGRYGGEEFLIILPDCDLQGARACAERVRRALAAAVLENGCRMTVSAGVAEHRPADTVHSLLARADAALYRAKRQGRNTVVAEGDSALKLSLAPVFEFSGRFRRS